jgi:nitrite reductase/ring-hydroxylating ferredoxin subunit
MTKTYHDVGAEADLASGQSLACLPNGWPVLVARSEGGLFAVINRCTHAESPLQDGRVRRNMVICPLHGARFELATGMCVGGPYRALKTFEVRIENGRIEVAVPDALPGHEQMPVRLA